MRDETKILKAVSATLPSFEVRVNRQGKFGDILPIILYAIKDKDYCREFFIPMVADGGAIIEIATQLEMDELGICYDYGKQQLFEFFDSPGDVPLMQYIFNKCKEEQTTCVDIDENCNAFRDYDKEQKCSDEIMKKGRDKEQGVT